jgi:RND family efflux transporter MFP subunit
MNFYKSFRLMAPIVLPVMLSITSLDTFAEENHDDGAELSFTVQQMQLANIRVESINAKYMYKRLYAPGEIQANGYTSYMVSPRVESVILSRHAILGEHVEKGQALVTLFSEAVAQAQAIYRIRYADWQRAKKVNREVISDSEFLNTETEYFAAYSRLKAYGLTKQAINEIADNTSSTLGEYTLRAARSGLVLSDTFQQGQRVSAGDSIMLLSDEKELWVEARLASNNAMPLSKGTKAQLLLSGSTDNKQRSYQAEVIQQAHTIDAKTRTRIVRLKVKNTDHQLHPGLFVDVYFSVLSHKPVLAVPETALTQGSDGDWLIYIAKTSHENDSGDEDNHGEQEREEMVFTAQEVELGAYYQVFSQQSQQWTSWREVIGAAKDNKINVVTKGAFFITSQSAKSGFDTHNH